MKAASESLVVAYRGRVLAALAVAAVQLALTVWIAMRMSVLAHRRAVHVGADAATPPRIGVARETARRTVRVLLPMALTTLLVLAVLRSEEHTSELQSLMRISYAVFCLKKKRRQN